MNLDIAFGAARAAVTDIGAGLRSFTVAGVPYVETYPADDPPPLGCGSVLVPWPNRVADARWVWQGEPQRLEVTEPARGHAIHGLVRHVPWQVIEHEAAHILLATDIAQGAGWPVPLRTTIRYALDDQGLTVTHSVHNTGHAPVPFGVGAHPYPRAGHADRADCWLTLAAHTVLPLDPRRLIPSGPPIPVADTAVDFHQPRPLAGAMLDTPFGGCVPDADGLIRHRLTGPEHAVELWADPDFRWVQVFTPGDFPGRGSGAVAIEPMTCPPDALNSGIDLITLASGQSWNGRWGLHPIHPVSE